MNVTVENLSSVKKRVNFEIPSDRVAQEIDTVYEEIRKHAAIKGFRKGKAPMSVIEKYYGDRMGEDVLKNLINETCFKAFQDNKIVPIAAPVIDSEAAIVKGEPLKYSAIVEVVPEIDVQGYEGLTVKKETFALDEAIIEGRLKQMQLGMAQVTTVEEDRPVTQGDFALIDFTGYVDGVAFENGSAQDFQLEIGSGRFIPGFEEQVVGTKIGETKRIKVTFPEQYGSADLAGKDAEFDVTVKEIKARELPELDDDFAKECGEFETFVDLKAKIAEIYTEQEAVRIDSDLKDRLIGLLIEKNTIETPDSMVEKQLQYMLENMTRRLASQGLSMEMMGMNEESFKAQYRDTAVNHVKGMLLLEALAKKENITVEEAEIETKIQEIAAQAGQPVERVKQFYGGSEDARATLYAQVKEDKAIALILSKATVVEASKAELQDNK